MKGEGMGRKGKEGNWRERGGRERKGRVCTLPPPLAKIPAGAYTTESKGAVDVTGLRELLQTVETSPRRMSRKDWAAGSPRHRPISSDVLRASGSTQSAFSSPTRQCQTLSKDPHKKTAENVVHTSKIRRALLRFNWLSRADR